MRNIDIVQYFKNQDRGILVFATLDFNPLPTHGLRYAFYFHKCLHPH